MQNHRKPRSIYYIKPQTKTKIHLPSQKTERIKLKTCPLEIQEQQKQNKDENNGISQKPTQNISGTGDIQRQILPPLSSEVKEKEWKL